MWNDIRDYIEISYEVKYEPGHEILNVGEKFTIQISVMNKAPEFSASQGNPFIRFKSVSIKIQQTYYASPTDDNGQAKFETDWIDVTNELMPSTLREPITLDPVEMISTHFREGDEPVANIYVSAKLDYDLYFRSSKLHVARANIEPPPPTH